MRLHPAQNLLECCSDWSIWITFACFDISSVHSKIGIYNLFFSLLVCFCIFVFWAMAMLTSNFMRSPIIYKQLFNAPSEKSPFVALSGGLCLGLLAAWVSWGWADRPLFLFNGHELVHACAWGFYLYTRASMIMEVDLLMQRIFVCRRTASAYLFSIFTVPPFIRHTLRFHCVADCIVRGFLRGVRYQRQIVSIGSCMQTLALSEMFG